ncbi:otoferlin [Aricia agestis]|uniref:otoferlin n=1 Tax=Aricia agestis TaxID=91739 RepID=UPI001C202949|nr:otoferlin [Aricia agestis]
MSLFLHVHYIKVLKCRNEKFLRADFRGDIKNSCCLIDNEEVIFINEKFEWPLACPLRYGETLTLDLLIRCRWGPPLIIGSFSMSLVPVLRDGQVSVTDTMLGDRNRPVPVFMDFDVHYNPPPQSTLMNTEEIDKGGKPAGPRKLDLPSVHGPRPATAPGPHRPSTSKRGGHGQSQPASRSQTPAQSRGMTVHRQSTVKQSSPQSSPQSHAYTVVQTSALVHGSSRQTSDQSSAATSRHGSIQSSRSSGQSDDDENVLDNLEKNIQMMEMSLKNKETVIDIESGEDEPSRARRLKIAGKRILKRGFSLGGEKVVTISEDHKKRTSTFKTVRSFMRFGRYRQRDSSGDEEQGLIELPGTSSEQEGPVSHTSVSSEDAILVDTRSPTCSSKCKKLPFVLDFAGSSALKAADFQVCVRIIEARQLAGLNMDPVVCVQVGELKKYTSVKESTNCPYYNEYFVFDFHMPPVMLFDKIITLSVLQSRNILRSNKLLGNFKLDVATVWNQPERQFYHKWALLTDPDDMTAGAKGYLKCDISVIGKGDTIKIPPKSEKDEDDIEANLLLPHGVPIERQRARFIICVYKADGLPKMNYSIMANVKKAFTGESQDSVDPYVQISFAGMTGSTSVKKNNCAPMWNEQIVFSEMFPPLCQRIKVQLRDNDPVHPNIIGTHFIDLKTISHDGEKGFLPTFGPAYINFYGSTRDYSLIDQHSSLNVGMGEGVAYRARLLMSIRTEIMDIVENPSTEVEIEPTLPVNETAFEKNAEFFLFSCIFEANMIDKRLTDKHLQFELSVGNCGNAVDGYRESVRRPQDLAVPELDDLSADSGYWQSQTQPAKASSADKTYYFLPYWDTKPCMHVRSIFPDHRRRLYNSNLISKIIEHFEDGLAETQICLDLDATSIDAVTKLKLVLESISAECAKYVIYMGKAPPLGFTKLDRERQKLCIAEVDSVSSMTRHLKALITKHSIKDRMRTAYTYLRKLKHLCEDPQHSLPDVFIWLISNGKRLAYQRIPARDIMYSENSDEAGKFCGKMQTLFLKWPGKKASTPSGWSIPAKISIYLWMGHLNDKVHYTEGLPPGYEVNLGIKSAEKSRVSPPASIYYAEKHTFQMRAYIYQARSLIGSDSSGLSDPFARVIIGECTQTTQVIDETLSPTWDELLVFDDILLYSTMEQIKKDPPTVVIEIFDQDKVGKSEFIGRTLAKPCVKSCEDICQANQLPPALEWFDISRGDDRAGELLAAFELLELPAKKEPVILPDLPSPRESNGKPPIDIHKGPILPIPKGIRPTLSKYRIEVLFWGLRDLKRVHFLTVDKPRVDIECAGHIISSSVIQNAKRNPNFTNPIKYIDVELPDQDLYRPPLTIRVVDCRSFGRVTLVGTHTISSIKKYIYTPKSRKEREMEERKKSLMQLQDVDIRTNCMIQDDTTYSVENEKESCPLLPVEPQPSTSYGTGMRPTRKKFIKQDRERRRKVSEDSALDDDERSKDWWTKYFASVEAMIEDEKENKREIQGILQGHRQEPTEPTREEAHSPRPERDRNKCKRPPTSPSKIDRKQASPTVGKKNQLPKSSLTKIYPHELEAVPEYDEFKEWLHSFELYRGKKTGDDSEDEKRVVGVFKGAIKVYKWPLPKGIDDHTVMGFDPNYGFFQGVPNNEPIHVLVRIYLVKATDLHPMDMNGKADPYVVMHLGNKKITDKDNYVSKQLHPVFGKCFEIEATFPQDSMLTIQVYDWDLVGTDELIGETKIDLENRFYSRHRALCGLPMKYEERGFNRWRDAMKPTQILAKLCKEGKLEPPMYEYGRVRVARKIFNMPMENTELFSNPDTYQEQMALLVLRRWHEVPRVGTTLVTEHIETRPLYNPTKPGIEQGRLQLWVDMFPMDMPSPGPFLDISPRKPKAYELRVIIWNTDDVVLEDDAFFTGEKMSDIYVKGWLKGPDDCQCTDIHYRSLTGEGNFNWRFIYRFDYLEAEERIVITRKESVFSWDETECKIPARLELQVWDADHFSSDDFLGAVTLDLNRFPRGAKTSKLCTLTMLKNDGSVPMINIFKQKRVKGWWPFYIKRDTEEMELTGKVEAEIHLLTRDEADKVPAGMGRSEPDPLEKPNRPDSSFMWFLNPLKSMRYIMWHNYKWTIVRTSCAVVVLIAILLLIFAFPGYLVKKLLGV